MIRRRSVRPIHRREARGLLRLRAMKPFLVLLLALGFVSIVSIDARAGDGGPSPSPCWLAQNAASDCHLGVSNCIADCQGDAACVKGCGNCDHEECVARAVCSSSDPSQCD
jgi:hypothetical protein